MKTLLTRNAVGKVEDCMTDETPTEFHVPLETTAFNFVDQWPQNGDVFFEDGWVRGPEGEIRRKWFQHLATNNLRYGDLRIWAPRFDDIPRLEAARWKAMQRARDISLPLYENIHDKIVACGRTVYGRHTFNRWERDDKGHGVLVRKKGSEGVLKLTTYGRGVGFSWVQARDEDYPAQITTEDQALVDEWFACEERMDLHGGRSYVLKVVFEEAVGRKYGIQLWKSYYAGSPKNLHLIINNRNYWFRTDEHTHIRCFVYPEEVDTQVLEVKL